MQQKDESHKSYAKRKARQKVQKQAILIFVEVGLVITLGEGKPLGGNTGRLLVGPFCVLFFTFYHAEYFKFVHFL